MKSIISIALIGLITCMGKCAAEKNNHCTKTQDLLTRDSSLEKTNWKTLHSNCTGEVLRQIGMEYNAAMIYLSLGAHFAQDKVNRPGFAKFFFDSASEERQHAIKLIDYLSMRGEETSSIAKLVSVNIMEMPGPHALTLTGLNALEKALDAEVRVTESIVSLMKSCEREDKQSVPSDTNRMLNDYHMVDWLTGEFLEEQYKGQRDLAGKISTLLKMGSSNYQLGEFLFDKKLLANEV